MPAYLAGDMFEARRPRQAGRAYRRAGAFRGSLRLCARAMACALSLLVPAGSVWAFGFSVEPARVQLSVPPGKRRGQTLTVRNAKTDSAIHLTTSIRDIVHAPDGTHDYPEPGSTAWSCASWIRVVPEELEIPPKSTRDVRVSVEAPPDAQGGRYAIIFFETGPSYEEQGIGVNFRVGALVEAVIPGTAHYDATLRDVSFVSPSSIRVDLLNASNLLVRPKGPIKVFDAVGKKVRTLPFNPNLLGVLPQSLRQFSTPIEDPLPAGSYRLKVEVDYGARTLIVGERSFQIE